MIDDWYLLITLFVLQRDGNIDKRILHATSQDSYIECELERNARIDLLKPQIGQETIRLFTTGYTSCYYTYGWGGCERVDYDKDGGTHEVGLTGTLIGFDVGCKNQPKLSGE